MVILAYMWTNELNAVQMLCNMTALHAHVFCRLFNLLTSSTTTCVKTAQSSNRNGAFQPNIHCAPLNGKVSAVFSRHCFPKMKDFSRFCPPPPLQAVTYTVKVVVTKKWCNTDTLLLHTTNMVIHLAYQFLPFL